MVQSLENGNKFNTMRQLFILITLIFCSVSLFGQINYSTDLNVLNADPGEGQWDGTSFSGTNTYACDGYSMKDNSYGTSASQIVEMTNSSSLGVSLGGVVTVSYDYKMLDWNTSTAAIAADFKEINIYSSDASSGPWTLQYTLNSHSSSTSCVTESFTYTHPAGDVYLQFTFEHSNISSPDVDIFFDNISVVEAVVAPNAGCDSYDGDFSVNAVGYNSGGVYTQRYVLVDEDTDLILNIGASGSFTGLSAGNYEIYAVNYENAAPSQLAIGNTWTSVVIFEAGGTGCIDLSTKYLDKVLTVCEPEEICEPDNIVVSTINHNTDPGFSQTFVLVDNSNNIIASNLTGVFTIADYISDGIFEVYAVNTDEAVVTSEIADGGLWQDILDFESAGNCLEILGPRVIQVNDVASIACNIALPVALNSFSSSCNNSIVTLNWQTNSEQNNAGFYVERSVDGIQFLEIDFVEGNGNSNIKNTYNWEDNNWINKAYYRLKQVDYDNTESYTKLVFVDCNEIQETDNDFIVFSDNSVIIELENPLLSESRLDIYSISGQRIYTTVLGVEISRFTIPSNVEFASEMYLFKIYNQSISLSQKYIHTAR